MGPLVTLDELPTEVLFVLVCLGWAGYLGLITVEWQRNRRHDRDARRARRRVRAKRAEHGRPDHDEQGAEQQGRTEQPTEEAEERCIVHARSVRETVENRHAMPPGIPSIVERLDRWRD